jgi:hypothetical protein
MKTEIVVTFDGITELELQYALQGLRNIEQENPERISMFMMVTAPEISNERSLEILKSLKPPFSYFKSFTDASVFTTNRDLEKR